MNTDLPPTVPALKPEQICAGELDGPNGTHCLAGWAYHVFNPDSPSRSVWAALDAAASLAGQSPSAFSRWNDSHTPKERAAVWGRAVENLGYVRRGDVFVRPEAA